MAGPMPVCRDVFEALCGSVEVPAGICKPWGSGPRSRSVDMSALLMKDKPADGGPKSTGLPSSFLMLVILMCLRFGPP